jgi:hypothetical protein
MAVAIWMGKLCVRMGTLQVKTCVSFLLAATQPIVAHFFLAILCVHSCFFKSSHLLLFFCEFSLHSRTMFASSSQCRVRQRTKEGLESTRARVETRPMIIERNVVKADVMIPPFDFKDRLIWENHRDYLYHCSSIVYPRLVRDFYG